MIICKQNGYTVRDWHVTCAYLWCHLLVLGVILEALVLIPRGGEEGSAMGEHLCVCMQAIAGLHYLIPRGGEEGSAVGEHLWAIAGLHYLIPCHSLTPNQLRMRLIGT